MSGTVAVDGLSAPVRVVRDRWGIPHIYAERQDDVFFAQGFVQAQDRLFQMDVWRRAAQGRLAEVLGANFIERDVMTRRMQFRGSIETDWAGCAPDVRAIAGAFVRGVNAWVAVARDRMPEEFRLAGWRPDFWTPDDLLSRTDAFVSSGSAIAAVLRARLVAAVGVREADRLLPPGAARTERSEGPTVVPRDFDPAWASDVVSDALRRVGTSPFFLGLAHPQSNAWVVASDRSASGLPLLANDPHPAFAHPSLRYLVHLHAPGWSVAGATYPWLPGVAIGHNDRIAWGLTAFDARVQDVYVERVNPDNPHQVQESGRWVDIDREQGTIPVKGRAKPFLFDLERTRHGIVVAVDGARHLAFTVRWTGTEPCSASELGALALDRARDWPEVRAALAWWKLPAVDVVYADAGGNIGHQSAALVPIRRSWNGALPAPAWPGTFEWTGWRSLDDLPHALNPREGYIAAANNNVARINRLQQVLAGRRRFTVGDLEQLQHDTVAWNAERVVPLLARVRVDREDVEGGRQELLKWDHRVSADSAAAALYVFWEQALRLKLLEGVLEGSLARDYLAAADSLDVAALARLPSSTVVDALIAAFDERHGTAGSNAARPWGAWHVVSFQHPLAITEATRRRFDVGPFPLGGYNGTVMASYERGGRVAGGASFRAIVDIADWDRSVVINAPGQSGAPGSPHFSDLATIWAAGEYVPLSFSDRSVQTSAGTTLLLTPRGRAQ